MNCLNDYTSFHMFDLKTLPVYSKKLQNMVYHNRRNCEITIRPIRRQVEITCAPHKEDD